MKSFNKIIININVIIFLLLSSCDDGRVNVFSIEEDIQMGREITNEIKSNPNDFPILSEHKYPEAYASIYNIRDGILASGELKYADEFDWDIYIIDEEVLNAFALPGGNTFYYTGLIKYLDDEASLAGVMAHEFAHCDRRHTTNRLTKVYGYQLILSMLLGNDPSLAAEIAACLALGLSELAFSRSDEYEADEYAVKFLNPTSWDSRGVAYFFEKMEIEKESELMKYFSTHPHPDDRIDEIYNHWEDLGKKEGELYEERYQDFKGSLP